MPFASDGGGVPAIVRVAGLPVSAVTVLRGDRTMTAIARLDELDARMAVLRDEAAARIFEILTAAEPPIRRHLLQLKRDCFNGVALRRHREAAHWPALRDWLGGDLGDRLGACEDELIAVRARFQEHYLGDRDRAREHLRGLTRDAALMRGVTLASPGLAVHLDRLHERGVDQYQRREHKLVHSLLRYVTRAAVKLSPYSTLTKIGLAVIGSAGGDVFRLLDGPWSEHSMMRVKRYLLDQCCGLLFHHPAVRDQLGLRLNDTIEDTGDALYRFLRPAQLAVDADRGDLRHRQPSIVQVRLRGPLIGWLHDSLAGAPLTHAAARSATARRFDVDPAQIDATLLQLVDIGFLHVAPPWASHEIHLEPRLLEFVRGIDAGGDLDDVVAVLDELAAIERGFAGAADSLRAVTELDRTVSLLFERIKAATRPDSLLRFEKADHNYYEDVLVHAAQRAPAREVLHLDRGAATELAQTGELLWRLTNLYEPRHELVHALYHFVRERWPGRDRVPLLELFTVIQPLWERYLAHLAAPAPAGREPFDPFELPAVAELHELRAELRHALPALYTSHTGDQHGVHIPRDQLHALVDRIPARYRPVVPVCLFLQPADAEGQAWVLNRLFESTGRFSSRYTAVLESEMRALYTGHFERGGRLTVDGEQVELLDMLFTRGNTVNLHWPQTPKVLEVPGERADVPAEQRLRLRDLVVAIDHPRRSCVLRDTTGQRYIPCFLSPLQTEFLPSLLKLLDVFGPMPRSGMVLPRTPEVRGGIQIYPRLSLGRLIVLRRRWLIAPDQLPARSRREDDTFLAVQRWRRAHGIPEQCFLIEQVTADYTTRKVYKPQYLDFRAPELVTLFLASVAGAVESITLEEAVPVPDAFPRDDSGQQRGVEVILESLVLHN